MTRQKTIWGRHSVTSDQTYEHAKAKIAECVTQRLDCLAEIDPRVARLCRELLPLRHRAGDAVAAGQAGNQDRGRKEGWFRKRILQKTLWKVKCVSRIPENAQNRARGHMLAVYAGD